MENEKIKILIIDDDEVDRKMIIRTLKLSGFSADVSVAVDIESGELLAKNEKFDCIFLDYSLPGSNGFQFLDNHNSGENATPVIMVTSIGDEKLAVESIKKGAFDYVPKNNITPEYFTQLLHNALQSTRTKNQSNNSENGDNSSSQLESVISKTPLILFSLDQIGVFTLFKGRGIENLEIQPDKIVGKSIFETGINIPVQVKEYTNALQGNLVCSQIKVNDCFYEVHFLPVFDSKKCIVTMNGVAMDITLVKKNEEELQKLLSTAEETQKIKEQFLANMSHEIRTPIHGILNLSEILLKTALDAEQNKYLSAIKKSADNLLVIINDILDLSKIEAQKMTFENIRFNLKETVNMVYEMFKSKAVEKNIEFKINIDDSLPVFLSGDQVRLNQILNNLSGNAIKFTDKGVVQLEVMPEEINEKYCLINFRISDTGIGIPQHKLNSIFNSFTQAGDEITRKYGGTGLGLSICKKLVELQGGRISVESKINEGSVFTFSLSFENISGEITTKTGEEASNEYCSDKPIRILVVDDNDINRLVISSIAKDWGFILENAADGSQAIDKLSENNYDLVLMDIEMPGMNGYETTRHIRKNLPASKCNIPILAMTAHANTEEKEKCFNADMNDYISKPFETEEFKNKIIALLNSGGRQNENGDSEEQLLPVQKCINLNYLREISENNDSFFKDFINLFLKNAPVSVTEMEAALQQKDWERLRQAAHKIKPSLSYLGMKEIHLAAISIEENAKKQINLTEIPALLNKIKVTCNKAYSELEQELLNMSTH